jgi:glycosyltransferase involved in cell wall biosynthesis
MAQLRHNWPPAGSIVYLVEERANPSTDCFVLPAVSVSGLRVLRCGPDDLPTADEVADSLVVFVRYVPSAWADLVDRARPRLRRLVFFMDDDVLDARASVGMPWRYRFKLLRLAASRRRWLQRQGAELWVSTPYLQQKYAGWLPKLIAPTAAVAPGATRRVFYHGSASHTAEIRWLRPVMEATLRRDERLVFEIFGGRDVYRLYQGVPRVTVIHPMRWPTYQALVSMSGRHVGLAPLLDLPFNRGRSYTKFFDITQCGAVGVYASGSACAEVVRDGVEGLVAEMEQEAWVDAILRLTADEPQRQAMLSSAQTRLIELSEQARQGYLDVFQHG